MKKTFVCRTNKNGCTRIDLSPDGIVLPASIDEVLGNPENRDIIVMCIVVPEGWRAVTEEEKKIYNKPICAKYWDKDFLLVADRGVFYEDAVYIVPEDFKFEPVYVKR